jgi:Leu/Phe-tRNA-protein transferase
MFLRYTTSGFLIIRPQDDPHWVVSAMLETGYDEEFCISPDFEPAFIARLMKAGFLVMSTRLTDPEEDDEQFILLPKLHLARSVLFLDNLHIKKSIKRHLEKYQLYYNTDFDCIIDRCIETHGDDWLTPPLVAAIRNIRQNNLYGVQPASFALYRNGKLIAGEFGITVGRVYTSYSGYYDENNAGTIQLIGTARYLEEHGFSFFDLGMPLEYKTSLGAQDLCPQEFVALFRSAQEEVVSD